MDTKRLGRTDLEVSVLGLGGLFVSSHGAEFDQGRAAVLRALELGINYIDTAPGYADSEEVLGKILKDVERPVILSTKLGGRPSPFLPQDTDCLMQSVEESLGLLGREQIDILMIHEPDRPGQYDWWPDPDECRGPVLDVLDQLKKDGVIRYTGIGGTTAYQLPRLIRSGKFDVVLTAFNYSLLWREAAHEVLPAAVECGVGVIAGSPLQQGALARRRDAEVQAHPRWLSGPRRAQFLALYALLDEIDMPITELAMRFVMSNPQVATVLTGSRSAEEVEQNVESAEKGPLPAELIRRVDEIAAMVPFRPFEEPFGLPFGSGYRGPGVA